MDAYESKQLTKDKTAYADGIQEICGVECYEKDGTAYLKLETVARELGFARVAKAEIRLLDGKRLESIFLNCACQLAGTEFLNQQERMVYQSLFLKTYFTVLR